VLFPQEVSKWDGNLTTLLHLGAQLWIYGDKSPWPHLLSQQSTVTTLQLRYHLWKLTQIPYRLHKLNFCHLLRIAIKSFHSAINLLLIWFYSLNRRTWWSIGMAMPQALQTDGTLTFVTCVTVSFYHALSGRWIQTFQVNRPLPPSRTDCVSPQNVRTTYITILCHTSKDCNWIKWYENTKFHSYQVIYSHKWWDW